MEKSNGDKIATEIVIIQGCFLIKHDCIALKNFNVNQINWHFIIDIFYPSL